MSDHPHIDRLGEWVLWLSFVLTVGGICGGLGAFIWWLTA